jgi:hypothetical protein
MEKKKERKRSEAGEKRKVLRNKKFVKNIIINL